MFPKKIILIVVFIVVLTILSSCALAKLYGKETAVNASFSYLFTQYFDQICRNFVNLPKIC
jgi:hypothetical protein